MTAPHDIQGKPIAAGQRIAYALSWGRGAALATYDVLEVEASGVVVAKQLTHAGRATTPTRPSRLLIPNQRALIL